MTEPEFDSLPSWSVECSGITFDDARAWHGIWFYRHIVTREIRSFPPNKYVSPICRNNAPVTGRYFSATLSRGPEVQIEESISRRIAIVPHASIFRESSK